MIPVPAMLAVLSLACNTSPKDTPDSARTGDSPADTGAGPAPDTVPLGGTCPLDQRYGDFVVESYIDYAIVTGTVLNGVIPVSVLEEVEAAGECRLLRRNNPACNPACESDETCDFDGTCIPYPAASSLGTVTIGGLLEPASMEPVPPSMQYFLTRLPNPPWTTGGLIALQSSGGEFDPVALHGIGVDALQNVPPAWILRAGTPLALTWDLPAATARASVDLVLTIDQHGLTPISLTCSFADDGAGEVPAALIDLLIGAGVTGFPNGHLTRNTVDAAMLTPISGGDPGCVEFRTGYRHDGEVAVEGFVPCDEDADCPDGLSCNEPIELCE